jgi:hypothetical protein
MTTGPAERHPADDGDEHDLPGDERGRQAHGAPHAVRRRSRFHVDGLYGKRSIEASINAR